MVQALVYGCPLSKYGGTISQQALSEYGLEAVARRLRVVS